MIEVSLLDFLRSGKLGPVHLGQTRAHIEAQLGPPDDKGSTSNKHKRPQIWKYGDIELCWPQRTEHLQSIYFDHFSVPSGGSAMNLDASFIRGRLARAEAEEALRKMEIAYREVSHVLDTHQELETDAHVRLLFVDKMDWQGLYAVSLRGSTE